MENRDYRQRPIMYDFSTGERILHKPTKKLQDCFVVETISWTFEGTNLNTGRKSDFVTASGFVERNFRKRQANKFSFR